MLILPPVLPSQSQSRLHQPSRTIPALTMKTVAKTWHQDTVLPDELGADTNINDLFKSVFKDPEVTAAAHKAAKTCRKKSRGAEGPGSEVDELATDPAGPWLATPDGRICKLCVETDSSVDPVFGGPRVWGATRWSAAKEFGATPACCAGGARACGSRGTRSRVTQSGSRIRWAQIRQ